VKDDLHTLWRLRQFAQARMAREGADMEALAFLLYLLDAAADRQWQARAARPATHAEPWEDRMLRMVERPAVGV